MDLKLANLCYFTVITAFSFMEIKFYYFCLKHKSFFLLVVCGVYVFMCVYVYTYICLLLRLWLGYWSIKNVLILRTCRWHFSNFYALY